MAEPTDDALMPPAPADVALPAPVVVNVPAAAVAPADRSPDIVLNQRRGADAGQDGLGQILFRQWPVVATVAALAVLLGVAYLLLAAKTYSASAKLRVSPVDVKAFTAEGSTGNRADAEPEDYLDTECVVIKSDAVLALALDAVKGERMFRTAARPLDVLRAGVDAAPAKKGKAIEVTFTAPAPAEAERVVAAVVAAYRDYNTNFWLHQSDVLVNALKTGSADQTARLKELEDRLMAIQQVRGVVINADPAQSQEHVQVVGLREARDKVALEAIAARTAYQEAGRTVAGDPALAQRLRVPSYSADPKANLARIQNELQIQQQRLTDHRGQYLPNHPLIRQDQGRIGQLTVDAVVAAREWKDTAEGNLRALDHSVADAQRAELDAVRVQVEYGRLQQQIATLRQQQNQVNRRVDDTELAKGAGAVNVSLLDAARADLLHPRPGPTKTLAIALAAGLITGAGVGVARDYADDRFRTLPAVRAAAGAPVLGAIPAIPASVAATAADRGQVVQFDPFGDAAESYRTLRTALQFGLPPRTKTLLITSPTAGDGKSTLVSNLGIALAQANRRVLIVDADLRAPVQHRLHNLDDATGLSNVLDGSDELDDVIQRTGVERLDVLPAGPVPSNPAEMINLPAMGDLLNDLADRYDFVLVDSPPVMAVTDARILAAHCDASLLVVKLGTATRRQAEAARDALRGVGAKLIGVAVNGVSRRADLASATGYYARPEQAPAPVDDPLGLARRS